jgi:hypothetical protein
MNSFLSSMKADLLGVRLRLVVILLAIGLLAAVGYVAFGGKKSAPASAGGSTGAPATIAAGSLAISPAPTNPNLVVAETTDGASHERSGVARNPFTPLPGAGATGASGTPSPSRASTPGISTSTSSTTTSSPGASTTPSGGSPPVAKAKPAPTKTKTAVHYNVAAQFGVIATPPAEGTPVTPSATPPASIPALKTYLDLPLDEPLPNKSNPQLVFLGVVLRTGKSAVFALAGEAILHGSAVCLPSATQCQTIQLQPGQSETLEAVEPSGTPVTYELKIISIVKSETSSTKGAHTSARAHAASRGSLKAGKRFLRRRGGVTALSGLEYSHTQGVLVFAAHPASRANARAAARRGRHGH